MASSWQEHLGTLFGTLMSKWQPHHHLFRTYCVLSKFMLFISQSGLRNHFWGIM